MVDDPKSADVIFRISTNTRSTGLHGQTTQYGNNSNTDLYETRVGFTRIEMLEAQSGQVLWSDTRRWGNMFTGFRSATKAVVKELRKRIEEQESRNGSNSPLLLFALHPSPAQRFLKQRRQVLARPWNPNSGRSWRVYFRPADRHFQLCRLA